MASIEVALLLHDRRAERSAVLVNARHWRLGMALDLIEEQGAGDWTFSWHRRKRNNDADGAGKPWEALIACVRLQLRG